jgi:hypothetical protein
MMMMMIIIIIIIMNQSSITREGSCRLRATRQRPQQAQAALSQSDS